jgi:uncharacterized membrane protein YccF (DUF307 family)
MRLLGNILWFLFGGFIACIGYVLGGLALCLTIVGIPFGFMFMRLGVATLAPFGKEVVARPNANGPLRIILNLIWIFCFGWGIAISHLVWALLFAITIVGIPFAKQHVKLIPLALFPFGRDLV